MLPIAKPFSTWSLVPRDEWGAQDPHEPYAIHNPKRIVVHHSYRPTIAEFKGPETIRGIQRFHQETQQWSDIAYHFLISPDGSQVFEGRPPEAVGAHCGGHPPTGVKQIFGNTGSIGICLIGNYDDEEPTVGGLRTLLELIGILRDRFGIAAGNVLGHFEAWSRPPKTCPGKNIALAIGWLQRWERAYPK